MKVTVSALFAAVLAEQPTYDEWAAQYGFNGADDAMKAQYEKNVNDIEQMNAQGNGATFGVNQFSGMAFEEFSDVYLNMKQEPTSELPRLGRFEGGAELDDVDWDVTPVKDQGTCGSCWAFASMGAIEAIHKQSSGATVSLSEQQLLDCEKKSKGCEGGWPHWAFDYLTDGPIYTTDSYPYKARQDSSCGSGTDSGVRVTGYQYVDKSDSAIVSAVSAHPITVTVNVTKFFQHYRSGILAESNTTGCDLNHAVVVTGYGSDHFKIKNSWGKTWGENGYIRIKRTTEGCGPYGIYTVEPSVPVLATAEVQV